MTLRGYGRWHPGTPTLGRAVLCFRACARRRWTLCTRWQRVMWHAGTPRRAASTRVNPVRHLRLLPHRHQGGRRAPWSDAPRRSSSPPWRVERRHAGPCAQLCTRQGSCPPRPSFQIGSRDRSASETTTTGSHSLLDSLECRVLIGAVCVSSHASRGCRGICFDHCCLEVCRLSKFSFFDRYLLQSTRSRVGSRGLAVFRGVSISFFPRAAPLASTRRHMCGRRHFHSQLKYSRFTLSMAGAAQPYSVREKLVQRSLTKVLNVLCPVHSTPVPVHKYAIWVHL